MQGVSNMANWIFYGIVVLTWGSAWIMLKFQLGMVSPEVSIAYRMGFAAVCMFVWSALAAGLFKVYLSGASLSCAARGADLSWNFLFFYHATGYLTTGLIAVICSTATIWIMFFNTLLLHRPPALRVLLRGDFGYLRDHDRLLSGIGRFIFGFRFRPGLYAQHGRYPLFSMGSIVSPRNQQAGFPRQSNVAWAMFYGTLLLTVFIFIPDRLSLLISDFPMSPPYSI